MAPLSITQMRSIAAPLGRSPSLLVLMFYAGLSVYPATAQPISSSAYTFTTIAGYAGIGSADGVGNAAQFNFPVGVAVDSTGNIYVADAANNTIRKITPGGLVNTIAGFAENLGGRLDGISRQLTDNQRYWETKFSDHDLGLRDHGRRITALERRRQK